MRGFQRKEVSPIWFIFLRDILSVVLRVPTSAAIKYLEKKKSRFISFLEETHFFERSGLESVAVEIVLLLNISQ